MDKATLLALKRSITLRGEAESLLGEAAWFLVESYGKVMAGRNSGHYVSSLTGEQKLSVAKRLAAGELLNIHLMHRHRSGNHEASSLKLREGRLVMVFNDREQLA